MNTNTQSKSFPVKKEQNMLYRMLNIFSLNRGIKEAETLDERIDLIRTVKNAEKEWLNANLNFEFANDMPSIDYYTYKIKACEVRYEYYLKMAKDKGIKV